MLPMLPVIHKYEDAPRVIFEFHSPLRRFLLSAFSMTMHRRSSSKDQYKVLHSSLPCRRELYRSTRVHDECDVIQIVMPVTGTCPRRPSDLRLDRGQFPTPAACQTFVLAILTPAPIRPNANVKRIPPLRLPPNTQHKLRFLSDVIGLHIRLPSHSNHRATPLYQ